jgi:tetratricopeptide (TPR) repeat protein
MSELPFDMPRSLPLDGERVVFAGKLWALGRRDARALVERLGGVVDEDLTLRTTLMVFGADTYPDGVPDVAPVEAATDAAGVQDPKLRRALQLNLDHPGRVRFLSEDELCRLAGLTPVVELRKRHYGQRDVLARYDRLREDHLRYLQKWGFIRPAFRNLSDTWYGFADLTLLRQVHAAMAQGSSFRAVLRDLQAARAGQLAFDFRLDAEPARILNIKRKDELAGHARTAGASPAVARPLTVAEQFFLMGSVLDDGTPEHLEEATQCYRRALDADPDLVAALINLANIRYSRDELAEAQALYERAAALDPTYFEAFFNLGNIHHDYGRHPEAEVCYREALTLNPSYAEAHF